ncbi:uncharacterized protein VTP21DRAFT_9059 [Calcarisporiella thermophila]|uniref:uncharacterized protein n=1 Tax=Calcarisporiella thermophila TaxID=911321 RepID=UPI0037430CE6
MFIYPGASLFVLIKVQSLFEMVVPRVPHLFISFSTGHGHAVPILSFARRLINTPNALSDTGATHGHKILVTIAIVDTFADELVATGFIPSPDEHAVILRGSYGEVRLVKLHDLLVIDPQKDGKYPSKGFQCYIESARQTGSAIERYLREQQNPNNLHPVTAVILDTFIVRSCPKTPNAGLPFYIIMTTGFSTSPDTMFPLPPLDMKADVPYDQDVRMDSISPDNFGLIFAQRHRAATLLPECRGFLWNTVDGIEGDILQTSKVWQANYPGVPVRFLGPLNWIDSVDNSVPSTASSAATAQKDSRLQKQQAIDAYVRQWMDSQEDASVLFVAFGSVTVTTPEQKVEQLRGLISSGRRILWVLRGSMEPIFPYVQNHPGIPEGMLVAHSNIKVGDKPGEVVIVPWAPQRDILAHRATAAFLTHCGWNSTMEALMYARPTLGWPGFCDQADSANFLKKLGVGINFPDTAAPVVGPVPSMESARVVPHDEITERINELFASENFPQFVANAKKYSLAMRSAWNIPDGSSYLALVNFVAELDKF